MSIFIDPNAFFPIEVRYVLVRNAAGKPINARIIKSDAEIQSNEETIVCNARARDFDTFSQIMEEATIINHISAKPMIRTKTLWFAICRKFFIDWNEKNKDGELIPIPIESINQPIYYNIIKALASKWLRETS